MVDKVLNYNCTPFFNTSNYTHWVGSWNNMKDCIAIMNGVNLSSHRVRYHKAACGQTSHNTLGRPLVFANRPGKQEQWSKNNAHASTVSGACINMADPDWKTDRRTYKFLYWRETEEQFLETLCAGGRNSSNKFTTPWLMGKSHLVCCDRFKNVIWPEKNSPG